MAEMSLEQRQYLTAKFKEFIAAVHSSHESNLPVRTPYQWQIRLMLYVAEHGYWPRSIGAPTASGKTSVIDIHVFLNARQYQSGPRVALLSADLCCDLCYS